jgi:hypothetical protein
MKTIFALILVLVFSTHSIVFPQPAQTYVIFNPNNISTHIVSSGIFNQDIRTTNTPGFMWPAGSQRFALFSTGLCIGAKVNGAVRLATASYHGEYCPGYILNGSPVTDSDFKIYKVSYGDGPSNPDWANWYKMVPFGAPYVDVNHNGIFDPNIDTPGVKNAQQTIFLCMTDGFTSTHTQSEGFSGGTAPLFAESHFTAWGYTYAGYNDMQYLKWEIINKGTNGWDSTYMGIFCDPDLGDESDDYIGCDTSRQLAYCYNMDNMDGTGNIPSYGANPPAVGLLLLKGCMNQSVSPAVNLRMTSFHPVYCYGCSAPLCELDPSYPMETYTYLKGFKKDGSNFMNPLTTSPSPVKFCYTGDPESNTGWTQYRGSVRNCGGDTGTVISVDPLMDRRFLMNSGAENFRVNPGDTQKIVMCQLIARGTNNLNSVTKLKILSERARCFYNSNFVFHSISGSVRYTDNNQPVTSGIVKALKLDRTNGSVLVLDSANIHSDGSYLLSHVSQDSVDIGLYPVITPPRDYLICYYPSTIYWQQAIVLYPTGNLANINLGAIRIAESTAGNSVNGKVMGLGDLLLENLKDANLYAKNGNTYVRCTTTDGNGIYHLISLPAGNLKIIVDRLGFKSDSTNVTVTSSSNTDSVNFFLNRIYVGINQIGSTVPGGFMLSQNFPNPFNPVTNIKFDLPDNGKVKLVIYNLLGQETSVLVNQSMDAGSYSVTWNASSYPSGVYFYRIYVTNPSGHAGDFIQTKKMILIK